MKDACKELKFDLEESIYTHILREVSEADHIRAEDHVLVEHIQKPKRRKRSREDDDSTDEEQDGTSAAAAARP